MRERAFVRWAAWTLGALLVALVASRASGALPVPPEAIALTASTLFCIGVGATVASPQSSPVRLSAAAERAVRRRHVGAGSVISLALALLLLVPEVRQGPTPWVLAPVIALGPVLAVREALLRSRSTMRPRAGRDRPDGRP